VGRTQHRRQNRFHPWPTQRQEGPFSSSSNLPGIISSFPFFLTLSLSLSLSLSLPVLPLAGLEPHLTFDSAKFETSFHATPPLFHMGRDAEEGAAGRQGRGGGGGSFSLRRALMRVPSCSRVRHSARDPIYPISNFGRCIRRTFYSRSRKKFFLSINLVAHLSLSLSLSVSLHQSRRFPDLDARRSWSIPISVNLLLFSLLNNALNNRSRVWPLERGSSVHFDTANRVRYRSPVSRESISVSFPLPRHHSNDISISLSLFLCDPENLSNQTFKAK